MSTRRTLLVGAAATLVVAADGTPNIAPHPDCELLDLCTQLTGMQAEWQRLYDATSDCDDLTTPADHAWQRYSEDVWPRVGFQPCEGATPDLPARLLTLPATTPDGLQAKAAAILAMDDAATYCDLRDDSYALCLSLVRDAAGLDHRPPGDSAARAATPLRPVFRET